MGPIDLLEVVGGHLDRLGCARFTTGSIASMLYGEPRFTNDVDMVVRISAQQVCAMADSFSGDDWYFSLDAATDAVRKRSMFNILHVPSGLKADLIVSTDDAFDRARYQRVRSIEMPSGRLEPFASPEDVMLKKLVFFKEGKSEKHLRDIRTMIAVQRPERLDWLYLADWSRELGVVAELELVRPAPK